MINIYDNMDFGSLSSRIISGHIVAPLLQSAALSGSLDANMYRISELQYGTSIYDAVNVGQLNDSISGSLIHKHDTTDIISGIFDPLLLGTGTPSAQTFLSGDSTWLEIEQVRFKIKNTASGILYAGVPVYATGSVGASGQVEVQTATASDSTKMPAIACVEEDIAVNGEGHGISVGVIRR